MKRRLKSIIAAVAAMTITTTAFAFTDTNGLNDTQMNTLNNAVENGIITGYEDDTVRPYGNLTRAEFAAMLCRAYSYNANNNCTFTDSASHWASAHIQACVERNAINGIGDNLFDPEAPITFNQATKIVSIVSGMTNGIDIDSLGGYPLAYLTVAQSNGLFENLTYGMTGEDYSLSRIDAITMIENANVPDNRNTSNTVIDNPEGKELMTITEAKAYVSSPVNMEFRTWSDSAKEEITSILFESFQDVITGKKAIDWHDISRKFLNAGYSKHIAEVDKGAKDILSKALRNFSEDGHQNGNIIIID